MGYEGKIDACHDADAFRMSSEICIVTGASLVQERVPNTPESGTKDTALRYPPPQVAHQPRR